MSAEPSPVSARPTSKLSLGCLGLFVLGPILFWWFVIHPWSIPRYGAYSGPIEDGYNAYAMHAMYGRTIDFSPDSNTLAYLWSDLTFVRPPGLASRPKTLTEKIELRIRPTSGQQSEWTVPLDSVDLRPDGIYYYQLDAAVKTAPDSQHVGAVCARRLVIADLKEHSQRSLEFPGEYFGGFAWLNGDEIAFSTNNGSMIQFWRYLINDAPEMRKKVYEEPCELGLGPPVPDLRKDQWSPNGRFVTVHKHSGEDSLLDIKSGETHICPYANAYPCWKRDSSAVLLCNTGELGLSTILMDPLTGQSTDLTQAFADEFSENMRLTWVDNRWTPDDRFVLVYKEDATGKERGYLLQPYPCKVLLSNDHILRSSPVPGWVLVQGGDTFHWMDYSGKKTSPIHGWPNDWTWSQDGHLAAKISKRAIEIFAPDLPGKVETK
jgi:hypothetical protein